MIYFSDFEGGPNPGHGSFNFDATNDYIELASAPASNVPMTIAAWIRPSAIATVAVAAVGDSAGSSRAQLDVRSSDDIAAAAVNSGGTSGVAIGGNPNANTWTLGVAVFTSATSRDIYQDGTLVDNDATNITLSGLNNIIIGSRYSSGTRGGFFGGQIAHVAVWDIALSGADITALAGGAQPNTVQTGDLVFYAPLTHGNAIDTISGNSLTVSGAATSSQVSPAGL